MPCTLDHELRLHARGIAPVAGVDEAGRGPLAGPVVIAAVILPVGFECPSLDDSKKLRPDIREAIHARLTGDPLICWAISIREAPAIDRINILRATHEGMREAVVSLAIRANHALIDGLPVRPFPIPHTALVGGDGLSASIAAASVIAKVTRDRIMEAHAHEWPEYGFERHKGYATPGHLASLRRHGPCPIHRRSFAPVAQLSLPLG
ncbi:MAG: ribonuclease HII [Terrimicrobiaceae bacterium]|nr:ribonuclease HII [Terrimicrobiaceae bacterium]